MAESLTWLSLAQAEGLPLRSLLQLVDETTRLPIPDVIDRGCAKGGQSRSRPKRCSCAQAAKKSPSTTPRHPSATASARSRAWCWCCRDVRREREFATQVVVPSRPRHVDGTHQPARVRESPGSRTRECPRRGPPSRNDVSGPRPVQGRERHLRPRCGRRVHAPDQRRAAANACAKATRLHDSGGDEFGVLLENCPSEPGSRIAEELRQAVADFRSYGTAAHLRSV